MRLKLLAALLLLVSGSYALQYETIASYFDATTTGSYDGAIAVIEDNNSKRLFVGSFNDDTISILNVSSPDKLMQYGAVTSAAGIGTADGISGCTYDSTWRLLYCAAFVDDAISVYNMTTNTPVVRNGTIAIAAGTGSLDGATDAVFLDINGSRFVIGLSSIDDTLSVYNNSLPIPTNGNFTFKGGLTLSAGNCSLDEGYDMETANGTFVLYTSRIDSTVSIVNVTAAGVPSCIDSYTDTVSPKSVDGVRYFYYENKTGLVYAPSPVDGELTILNASNPRTLVAVGGLTGLTGASSVRAFDIGIHKYAFVGSNRTDIGVWVVNVTVPATPTLVGIIDTNYTSSTRGRCRYGNSTQIAIVNDTMFVGDAGAIGCLNAVDFNITRVVRNDYLRNKVNISDNVSRLYSVNFINYSNSTAMGGKFSINTTAGQSQTLIALNNSLTNYTNLTISWRQRIDANAANQYSIHYGNAVNQVFAFIWTGTQYSFIINNGTVGTTYNLTTPVSVKQNMNFTVVIGTPDNRNLIYVNGTLLINSSNVGGMNHSDPTNLLQISGRDTSFYFGGNFSDLRIWNNSISVADVGLLNNGSNAVDCGDLIAHYNFEPNAINYCAASNSCTYSGSGTWNILGSDNCVLTTATDVNGQSVIVTGPGTLTLTGAGRIFDTPLIRIIGGVATRLFTGGRLG